LCIYYVRLDVNMSLKGPNDADVQKINDEINQMVNQRHLVTTLAITLVGAGGAWLIPKNIPSSGSNLDAFTFAGSILLLLLLSILYLYTFILRRMIGIFTTYLIVMNSSNWQYDWKNWQRNNKQHYLGNTTAITSVFLGLGILSILYPVIFAIVYSLKFASQIGFLANIVIGLVYLSSVVITGWWDNETWAKESWEELKAENL
jgi:hypothetical protein